MGDDNNVAWIAFRPVKFENNTAIITYNGAELVYLLGKIKFYEA